MFLRLIKRVRQSAPGARRATIVLALLLGALMTACETIDLIPTRPDDTLIFHNESDTWLTVRVHVADRRGAPSSDPAFLSLMSVHRELLGPKEEARFDLYDNPRYRHSDEPVIRLHVGAKAASFEENPPLYWIELVSPPPGRIVARGGRDSIKFESGDSQLTAVPVKYWIQDPITGAYLQP